MLYLLLNVVFASAFSLIIKWVQNRRQEDVITVGAINYIVAALWVVPEIRQTEFTGDATAAMVTGGIMGACYFVAYFFVIHAIRWIGVASTTVIGALSILLPVACGVLVWNEQPSSYQIVGVVLATLSLLLISGRQQKRDSVPPPENPDGQSQQQRPPWLQPLVLVLFFVLAGASRLAQEAFKHESVPAHRPIFLITAFAVAAVPSVLVLIARRRRVSMAELMMGFGMGAANILQTRFLLQALRSYDGFIVFPVSSAGGLLLTTLVATGLLQERLDRRRTIGIGIAIFALMLLNS